MYQYSLINIVYFAMPLKSIIAKLYANLLEWGAWKIKTYPIRTNVLNA